MRRATILLGAVAIAVGTMQVVPAQAATSPAYIAHSTGCPSLPAQPWGGATYNIKCGSYFNQFAGVGGSGNVAIYAERRLIGGSFQGFNMYVHWDTAGTGTDAQWAMCWVYHQTTGSNQARQWFGVTNAVANSAVGNDVGALIGYTNEANPYVVTTVFDYWYFMPARDDTSATTTTSCRVHDPGGTIDTGPPSTYVTGSAHYLPLAKVLGDCTGVKPSVLMGIASVESSFGTNVGPSSAGAKGPYQFLDTTWGAYQRDYVANPPTPDSPGVSDVWAPDDSMFAAHDYLANLIKAKGTLREALLAYNGATTPNGYDDKVLNAAATWESQANTACSSMASDTGSGGAGFTDDTTDCGAWWHVFCYIKKALKALFIPSSSTTADLGALWGDIKTKLPFSLIVDALTFIPDELSAFADQLAYETSPNVIGVIRGGCRSVLSGGQSNEPLGNNIFSGTPLDTGHAPTSDIVCPGDLTYGATSGMSDLFGIIRTALWWGMLIALALGVWHMGTKVLS